MLVQLIIDALAVIVIILANDVVNELVNDQIIVTTPEINLDS